MFLALNDLFQAFENTSLDKQHSITISYIEIYNENIRDLLVSHSEPKKFLQIKENPRDGIVVSNLSQHSPRNADEVLKLLELGSVNRMAASTSANAASSRSHAVLQIQVETRDRTANIMQHLDIGKLCLVDLAGSERASKTDNKGIRLREGANINKSLLALGSCINALSEGKGAYIPYRDSKLTRLLKVGRSFSCFSYPVAFFCFSWLCFFLIFF
jgi:kinesin family protein 18/19